MSSTYAHLRWVETYYETFILEVIVVYDKVTTHIDSTKTVHASPVLLISGNRDTYDEGVTYGPDDYSESSGWAITLMEPL